MEIFTDTERLILEKTEQYYKWIARDKDGYLYLYDTKPYRDEDDETFNTGTVGNEIQIQKYFSDVLFKNVTWKNSPIQFRADEPLLTPKEREYLKFVFKPFASNIICVQKMRSDNTEYIVATTYKDSLVFPYFTKGTMYKKMKLETKYDLKELGIEYNE